MSVKAWGVRGSSPCAGSQYLTYGGNTTCTEVRVGDRRIVLDLGSGAIGLGQSLLADGVTDFDIILSHYHYDHIQGLLFFAPFYVPGVKVRVFAPKLDYGSATKSVRELMAKLMSPPFFPVGPEVFGATAELIDFDVGDALDLGQGITCKTIALNHPGGASGTRIDADGRSFASFLDHEQEGDAPDPALVEFAREADLLLTDAAYQPEMREKFRGFGHSDWSECVTLGDLAGVGHTWLAHHDLRSTDDVLDGVASQIAEQTESASLLKEGTERAL